MSRLVRRQSLLILGLLTVAVLFTVFLNNVPLYANGQQLNEDTIDEDTIDEDTIDEDTIDEDTIDEDTIDEIISDAEERVEESSETIRRIDCDIGEQGSVVCVVSICVETVLGEFCLPIDVITLPGPFD